MKQKKIKKKTKVNKPLSGATRMSFQLANAWHDSLEKAQDLQQKIQTSPSLLLKNFIFQAKFRNLIYILSIISYSSLL